MTGIYQGDPLIKLTADGAEMTIKGGQPVMDQGLENFINISLFTRPGWFGNFFIRDENKKIGSKFLETAEAPITRTGLNNTRLAVEAALKNPVVGDVVATVDNTIKNNLDVDIKIKPPGSDVEELRANRNGVNWQLQAKKG